MLNSLLKSQSRSQKIEILKISFLKENFNLIQNESTEENIPLANLKEKYQNLKKPFKLREFEIKINRIKMIWTREEITGEVIRNLKKSKPKMCPCHSKTKRM